MSGTWVWTTTMCTSRARASLSFGTWPSVWSAADIYRCCVTSWAIPRPSPEPAALEGLVGQVQEGARRLRGSKGQARALRHRHGGEALVGFHRPALGSSIRRGCCEGEEDHTDGGVVSCGLTEHLTGYFHTTRTASLGTRRRGARRTSRGARSTHGSGPSMRRC